MVTNRVARWRASLAVKLFAVALVLFAQPANVLAEGSIGDESQPTAYSESELVDRSVRIRELLGFDSSRQRVEEMHAEDRNSPAIRRYGYIFDANELREYEVRLWLEHARGDAYKYAQELPSFAGAINEHGGKRFIVRLKDADAVTIDEIRRRFPLPERLVVDTSAAHSMEELISQRRVVEDDYVDRFADGTLRAIGVDVENGALHVSYHRTDEQLFAKIGESVSVPVTFGHDDAPQAYDACGDQDKCGSPQRAGVGIRRESDPACSSGFAVRTGSGNEMVLTAGHCWYGYGFGNIYASGNSSDFFGTLTSHNALYYGSKADARLIETSNSSTYNWVYWSPSYNNRVVGQVHRSGLAKGDVVCLRAVPQPASPYDCGSVTQMGLSEYHTSCGCYTYDHIAATYTRSPGTSGGAVTSSSGYTAVGIHSAPHSDGGLFSYIKNVEVELAVTVSTSA